MDHILPAAAAADTSSGTKDAVSIRVLASDITLYSQFVASR
jgi:hypothetical protein